MSFTFLQVRQELKVLQNKVVNITNNFLNVFN